MPNMLAGAFPFLFPFGCPYAGVPSEEDLKHMIHQASNAFTGSPEFLMYLFSFGSRVDVARGVTAAFKADVHVAAQLKSANEDPNFIDDLKYCAENPNSTRAKEMERWLLTLANKCAKQIGMQQDGLFISGCLS